MQNLVDRAERLVTPTDENTASAEVVASGTALREALLLLRDAPVGSVAFDDQLQQALLSYRYFKLQFLGGPYRAWLKEIGQSFGTRHRVGAQRIAFFQISFDRCRWRHGFLGRTFLVRRGDHDVGVVFSVCRWTAFTERGN